MAGASLRLRAEALSKRFGATRALTDASLSCHQGEVLGLVGENGAGKSTIIKILNGMLRPDSGRLHLDGTPVELSGPHAATSAGIATVWQELSLVGELSVAENLLLGREPRRFGLVDRRAGGRAAGEMLRRWDCPAIEPGARTDSLSLAQQQQVEIVRALSTGPRVLLLDEPTSALTESEVQWLFTQIAKVKEQGAAVVLISHRLAEVNAVCDRVTVLRSGSTVSEHVTGAVPDSQLVADMLGRELAEQLADERPDRRRGDVVVALRDVRLKGGSAEINLELHAGEIVGVAGLEGQGQAALFRTIFGLDRAAQGEITAGGRVLRPGVVRDAIRAGLGLVPESRKEEGLFLEMPVLHNASIASLGRFSRFGVINRRAEREAVAGRLAALRVATERAGSVVGELSGGNQQRVVFAKWMVRECSVLLLFDPTRGVDVGAKVGIFDLIRDHAAAGGAVLFFSSELDELLALADRIAVMYGSAVRYEAGAGEFDKATILSAMLGRETGAS